MTTELREAGDMREIGAVRAALAPRFEALAAASTAVARADRRLTGRIRGPLGRLLEAGQLRDAAEQRLAHLARARAIAAERGPDQRAAVAVVAAWQMRDLAARLSEAGEAAERAFAAIAEAAEDVPPGDGADGSASGSAAIAAQCDDGSAAAAGICAVARAIAEEADAALGALPGQGRGAVEGIAWMTDLYTMEDERRVHRAAVCGW